jgi:hypothetical protein
MGSHNVLSNTSDKVSAARILHMWLEGCLETETSRRGFEKEETFPLYLGRKDAKHYC